MYSCSDSTIMEGLFPLKLAGAYLMFAGLLYYTREFISNDNLLCLRHFDPAAGTFERAWRLHERPVCMLVKGQLSWAFSRTIVKHLK
jgi:hypothetical protein